MFRAEIPSQYVRDSEAALGVRMITEKLPHHLYRRAGGQEGLGKSRMARGRGKCSSSHKGRHLKTMRTKRTLLVGLVGLLLAATAAAQFDGPAPLAWRWWQPTKIAPSGAPVLSDTSLFTAVGGRVFALDRASGNLVWRFPAVEPIDGVFRTTPILVNKTLVAVGDNKVVYGVNAETGSLKWSYNLPVASRGQAILVDKYVVLALTDNKLITLNPEDGKPFWSAPYNIFAGIQGQISSYGTNILFFTQRNELQSLNLVTQKYNWSRPPRFSQVAPDATPVVYNDFVYLNSGPYLISIIASSGTVKWQRPTGLNLAFSPAVSTDGILVVSQDGEIGGFSADRGDPLPGFKKPVKLDSFALSRPVSAGSKFFLPTTNGAINLIDATNSKTLWSYIIRPIGEVTVDNGNNAGGGFPGGGAPGGPGGGRNGGGGMGAQNNATTKVTFIRASGPPVLGGKTLYIPAQDGSILAFDNEIGVDLTAPVVKMLFPNSGEQVSPQSPLRLIFTVADEASGINESTLKVEIDGVEFEHELDRAGQLTVYFNVASKKQNVTGTAPVTKLVNPTLSDGRKTIVVTVSDWLGNVAKQTYQLVIDNTLRPITLPGSQTNQGGPPGGGGRNGPGGGDGGRP